MGKKSTVKETLGGKLLLLAAGAIFIAALTGALGRLGGGDELRAADREARMEIIRSQGWDPIPESETEKTVRLPEEFPAVLDNYNQLQRSQGFDLKKYAGREIRTYTCTLNGGGEDTPVQSALYVYKNKVVGGDVHSAAFEGYMQPLFKAESESAK